MSDKPIYTNKNYEVYVVLSPKTPEVLDDNTLVYAVTNRETGVNEYYTNQLFEAMQNADWLSFMLEDNNWQKIMQEKQQGFIQHFAPTALAKTARELTASGPLN